MMSIEKSRKKCNKWQKSVFTLAKKIIKKSKVGIGRRIAIGAPLGPTLQL